MSGAPTCEFEDDGYYWYLWPAFEDLKIKTGQLIDLYGGCEFAGDSLISL